jgi:O-antigen/teichoic acid export membrane protein
MYCLMAVAKRQMVPSDFDGFAVLWALGFAGAAVASVPVEQELTRAVAVDVALEHGPGHDVRRAYLVTAAFGAGVAGVTAVAMWAGVFGRSVADAASVAVLAVLVVSECCVAISRGVLAGLGLTSSVAALTIAQAAARALVATALVLNGSGAVGVVVGVTAANLILLAWIRPIAAATRGGTEVGRELSTSGIRRLAASSLPRALFAIGTPALAGALARPDEVGEVGDVLVALSLTSAPVMLAAALQAVFLPGLATAVRMGRGREVDRFVNRALVFNTAVGGVASVGAALVGPAMLRLLFGGASSVTAPALAAMTAGAALLFLANLLTSVCIARSRHRAVSVAWSGGAVAMLATCAVRGSLGTRIGSAVFVGAAVVAVSLWYSVRQEPADETAPSCATNHAAI